MRFVMMITRLALAAIEGTLTTTTTTITTSTSTNQHRQRHSRVVYCCCCGGAVVDVTNGERNKQQNITSVSVAFDSAAKTHTEHTANVHTAKHPTAKTAIRTMERWRNRVAVITGASSGIGAACCRDLIVRGMIVVGLARRRDRMEQMMHDAQLSIEQQARFYALQCDVCNEGDIKSCFAWIERKLGGCDVLVNNAAILRNTLIIAENNTADLRAMIDTNVMGVALCTREAFRTMKARHVDGHVVIINDVIGHCVSQVPGYSFNIYAPTKHAVTVMTEILRQEFLLNGTKVKVSSISPGFVDTDCMGQRQHLPQDKPKLRPEDIADAVAYCIQTPPHVQIHEMIVRPLGEQVV